MLSRLSSMNEKPERAILHVDMDAFFVSVELLSRPEIGNANVPSSSSGAARKDNRTEPRAVFAGFSAHYGLFFDHYPTR